MKFKCTIVDIPTLAKLTQSLALLSKQAWIRLTPDSIQFIIQPSGTQVWATIETETLFTHYIIESNASNVINLEVNIESLGRLLRSISDTAQVSMKLTKRDRYPMLSFNTTWFGPGGGQNTITHDLHVRVLSAAFIAQIKEPSIPTPDVVILLPPLTHLAQVANGLRVLSDRLLVSANGNGEFSIGVETPAVCASTAFTHLVNPSLADPAPRNGLDTDTHDTPHDDRDVDEDHESDTSDTQTRPVPKPNQMSHHTTTPNTSVEPRPQPQSPQPPQSRRKTDWVRLIVDAKDWCTMLRISSISKSVIACFCAAHAIVLYVYASEETDDRACVLTYYIATYQE